jgi:hypothetical protein
MLMCLSSDARSWPCPHPVGFSPEVQEFLRATTYVAVEKTDGVHCLVMLCEVLNPDPVHLAIGFFRDGTARRLPLAGPAALFKGGSVFEGELVRRNSGGLLLLIFKVHRIGGVATAAEVPYTEGLRIASDVIPPMAAALRFEAGSDLSAERHLVGVADFGPLVAVKQPCLLEDAPSLYKSVTGPSMVARDHECDGVVLVPDVPPRQIGDAAPEIKFKPNATIDVWVCVHRFADRDKLLISLHYTRGKWVVFLDTTFHINGDAVHFSVDESAPAWADIAAIARDQLAPGCTGRIVLECRAEFQPLPSTHTDAFRLDAIIAPNVAMRTARTPLRRETKAAYARLSELLGLDATLVQQCCYAMNMPRRFRYSVRLTPERLRSDKEHANTFLTITRNLVGTSMGVSDLQRAIARSSGGSMALASRAALPAAISDDDTPEESPHVLGFLIDSEREEASLIERLGRALSRYREIFGDDASPGLRASVSNLLHSAQRMAFRAMIDRGSDQAAVVRKLARKEDRIPMYKMPRDARLVKVVGRRLQPLLRASKKLAKEAGSRAVETSHERRQDEVVLAGPAAPEWAGPRPLPTVADETEAEVLMVSGTRAAETSSSARGAADALADEAWQEETTAREPQRRAVRAKRRRARRTARMLAERHA